MIEFIRSWGDRKKYDEGARALYLGLLQDYQNSKLPGHGFELPRNTNTALFARYVRRKYKQLEVTILGDKIVISLRAGFDAVISKDLREHLERSGVHGQDAIEKYAEIAAAAKAAGLEEPQAAKENPAPYVDSNSIAGQSDDGIPEK